MHDPLVIAHEIRRPWPKINVRRPGPGSPQGPRWSAFWYIGAKELYFPPLVTVWHVEPDEQDAFTVCPRDGNWKWHVKHWQLQVSPLQTLKRRLITRCTHCMGRSTKANPVNVAHQWDSPKLPWWHPGTDNYHRDCSAKVSGQARDRQETEKNLSTWGEINAQVRILKQTAADLRYLGEEEAASYCDLRAREMARTVQNLQAEASAAMRARREARA